MDSHEEDGEIREARQSAPRSNDHDVDAEEDDFSMSSYDGDQGDSLDIKPPQAVVQRREKRDKRDKRDRHRHKGDRHKDRHRNREHRGHDERRREHRRHRERMEGDRREVREAREVRRHEKHRDRGGKHEKPFTDLRSKLEKRGKMLERDMERRRMREREEYYIDDRDYEHADYHREHISSRGAMGRGMMGGSDHQAYNHHRRDDLPLVQLSPRERAERDRRMERFLVADKQKELSQREAESRRQKREEERREEQQLVRHRGEGSSFKTIRSHSPIDFQPQKKRKHHHKEPYSASDNIDEVTILSEEEEGEYEEVVDDEDERKVSKDKRSDDDSKKKKRDGEHSKDKDGDDTDRTESRGSESSDTESDSERARSPTPPHRSQYQDSESTTTEESDDEKEDGEINNKKSKDTGDRLSVSGSGSQSARSGTVSPSQAANYDDSPRLSDHRSDRDEAEYLGDSPPQSPVELKERLPSYYPAIMGCRSVDEFECLNRIEEGTYGVVYRAREKATNQIVALKRLKMEKEKEGFPITSLREVNTLLK
ncbi:hypothetical protein SK128_020452, partial [Halocaridina rubra]